jgi:ubiquinone/menaquinone biosynthesis C-methylase UbiE
MKNEETGTNNLDGNNSLWIRYGGSEDAARIYEDHLVPAMFGPFAVELIKLSFLEPSDKILDVACGTGILSRHTMDHLDTTSATMGRVVGIDINPKMLKMAHRLSFGKNIEWVEGSATLLPFADGSFSLAMCQQGLQFFPDKLQSLKEMNRVLVSGGRIALSIWTSIKDSSSFDMLERLLQQIFGYEAAMIMHMPYSLSDPLEIYSLVKNSGFDDIEMREITKIVSFSSVEEFIFSFTRGSMLASYFSKVNENEYKKLLSYAKEELSSTFNNRDSNRLSFPLKSRFVFARKH